MCVCVCVGGGDCELRGALTFVVCSVENDESSKLTWEAARVCA